MNDQYNQNFEDINQSAPAQHSRSRIEENLVAQSFIFMTIALIITAVASAITLNSYNLLLAILTNNTLFYGLIIGELVIVVAANRAMASNNLALSAILFVLYSGINGMTLSVIFFVYSLGSIFSIFIMAAVIFGITAVFGLVTKKDLSKIGNICIMALIAIIVLGVANMFFRNEGMSLFTSAIGVFVFVGLAAYDAQKIKGMAAYSNSINTTSLAMFGALTLYLDFINLFLNLLRLFGKKN